MDKDFLTPTELCSALGISRWTLANYHRLPEPPPHYVTPAGRKRYRLAEVSAWLHRKVA